MASVFDCFLSHNSKDKPAVRELAEALRARGLNVWLDEWELIPGRPWQEALEEIIETAQSSAVLVGKDGFGPWQDAEMRSCLAAFVDRELPVIPVLLPGAPEEPKLPLFLRRFTWVDLRGGLTEEGLDRLQWGVTGQRPDRSKPLPAPAVAAPAAAPEKSPGAGAGEAFTEPLTEIRFLWIPGGRFQMGGNALDDEKPVHWVRLSPFWLSETPVTNRQYAVFVQKTGAEEPRYWRDRRFSSPDQPVVGVSWDDAVAFCRWLSEASEQRVFLPSEAQWEFAARSTDGREYPWGNDPPDEKRACFGLGEKGQTALVGSFPAGAGPFGTLDQSGNVWEWCRDAWDAATYAKSGKEPLDPVAGEERAGEDVVRVVRGGGWFNSAWDLRTACRGRAPAGHRSAVFGFRAAAALPSLDA
jgi:formylglycine-generating enzyme required for sulfatase activity